MNLKRTLLLAASVAIYTFALACRNATPPADSAIQTATEDPLMGLHPDENVALVQANCTGCHSAKVITMNRFTRDGWKDKIVWMQKTQNLWDLGDAEPAILDYLAKYYAPEERPLRRQPLEVKEWYVIK